MRAFLALALPREVREGIQAAFSRTRSLAPRAKWASSEAMHLTLHFFGEVPRSTADAVDSVLEDPVLQRDPIRARLGRGGVFPGSGAVRVLWAGLEEGVEEMREFWELLRQRLQPLRVPGGPLESWSPDPRGFSPHVTVARSGPVPIDRRWAEEVALPREEFQVSECVLFESMLGPAGARYAPLKRLVLRGGGA